MTRTGTKWIAMAIVLVLTTGAWAQREQKRPDRRPEGRSMADEYRGDRERQERQERQERERREEHRRDEHRRGKPDLRIFRFEHIPAQSFMEVLGQLSRRGPLGEILSKIPIALHEHSNAVVIIAPPEALELFEKLAEGLDRPSEFHKRMAQRRGPGCPGNCRGSNSQSPGKGPGCGGNCGGANRPSPGRGPGCGGNRGGANRTSPGRGLGGGNCPGANRTSPGRGLGGGNCPGANRPSPGRGLGGGNCPGANRPSPGQDPGEINAEAIKNAIGNPVGQLFGKILSASELRLDERQRKAMHEIAGNCDQRVGHMQQRVIQAIRDMNREERAANARKTVSHARAEMGKMAGDIRKHIFGILKPEQRKAAGRILGAPGPAGNKGAKPKGKGKGKPTPTAAPRGCGNSPRPTAVPGKPRPAAAPRACGGCGSRDVVLGDTGNCKTSDF